MTHFHAIKKKSSDKHPWITLLSLSNHQTAPSRGTAFLPTRFSPISMLRWFNSFQRQIDRLCNTFDLFSYSLQICWFLCAADKRLSLNDRLDRLYGAPPYSSLRSSKIEGRFFGVSTLLVIPVRRSTNYISTKKTKRQYVAQPRSLWILSDTIEQSR